MSAKYTEAQNRRLIELNADPAEVRQSFDDAKERDAAFRELEQKLVRENRRDLRRLLEDRHKSLTQNLIEELSDWLTLQEGFTRVSTPTIITSQQLDKMMITGDNALRSQVFWVDNKHCLRPMLAPNLYIMMRDIHKITGGPVRIFEIGSCFRKESQGAKHMNEFTMLNLVEFDGTEDGKQMERLEELAHNAMDAVSIENYELVREASTVYKETLDIEVDGLEVASGSFGPHDLDIAWGIIDTTWVGIGIGVERLAQAKGGYKTIKHVGRSLTYTDGIPLKL
ncbi:MAG: pyrrolysine--tRNA(Pyl) ligase large subunit [Clostridia bacterium]|nr:pyrrolysine--tRNA(Pyl) ligase large subunit [Clostridia bacterium]